MGLFDFFKSKPPIQLSFDWTKTVPKEFVDWHMSEINSNPQATETDSIFGCIGEFGLEKTNPIPTYGIPSKTAYLNSLRTSNGERIGYRRTGSFEVENIVKPVDEYEIFNIQGETIAFLYLSAYHWKTSIKSPLGFYLFGHSKQTAKLYNSPLIAFNQQSAYAEYLKKRELEESRKLKEHLKRTSDFKSDWGKFREVLIDNGINTLFHFTDKANLKSIKKYGGLHSWQHCISNNIFIPSPGGNELSRNLDKSKGLEDYVRVSFTRNHPMMFVEHTRDRNNVILEIDPEIIYLKTTMCSDLNANKNNANIGKNLSDFNRIHFDLFKHPNHFKLSENDRPYYQAEILVKNFIPLKYIKNINQILLS
jgi:ssDNA thymidine ADP-ribosyltransferase, DarT